MHSHVEFHLRKEDRFMSTKFPEPGAFVSLRAGKGKDAELSLMFTCESIEALDSLIIKAREARDYLHNLKIEPPTVNT